MLSKWLHDTLETRRLSQADLSRMLTERLGRSVDRAAVNKMVKGTRKIAADEMLAIEAIVKEMDGPPPVVSLPQVVDPSNAAVVDLPLKSGLMIPIYGQAVGGPDGEFSMNGNRIGNVQAPPSLYHAIEKAYAVIVIGESMEPRYFDGETVYVDPTQRVVRDDFVVVQIQTEEHEPPKAYVKRFVRRNDVELVLTQYNPVKELKFAHRNVVSVHKIVPWG